MKKIFFCFPLGTNLLFAQESDLLTLPGAISYALENKAEEEKARLDIKRGDAQIAEARAGALPQLSLSGNTNYNPLLQENVLPGEIFGMPGEDIRLGFGQEWTSNLSAQFSQVLFNQSIFTGLKAARSTREFYMINAQLTQEEIIEKVATSYFQVYQTKQMLENLERNLELTQETLAIVESLFENGLVKEIDFDRSRVALNNLTANRQQLINALQLSENGVDPGMFYRHQQVGSKIKCRDISICRRSNRYQLASA